RGKVHNAEHLPGFVVLADGEVKGIITYNIENDECEIVSLDSLHENCGIGSALINQAINEASTNRCKRVWLITTNDNVHAIRFTKKEVLIWWLYIEMQLMNQEKSNLRYL